MFTREEYQKTLDYLYLYTNINQSASDLLKQIREMENIPEFALDAWIHLLNHMANDIKAQSLKYDEEIFTFILRSILEIQSLTKQPFLDKLDFLYDKKLIEKLEYIPTYGIIYHECFDVENPEHQQLILQASIAASESVNSNIYECINCLVSHDCFDIEHFLEILKKINPQKMSDSFAESLGSCLSKLKPEEVAKIFSFFKHSGIKITNDNFKEMIGAFDAHLFHHTDFFPEDIKFRMLNYMVQNPSLISSLELIEKIKEIPEFNQLTYIQAVTQLNVPLHQVLEYITQEEFNQFPMDAKITGIVNYIKYNENIKETIVRWAFPLLNDNPNITLADEFIPYFNAQELAQYRNQILSSAIKKTSLTTMRGIFDTNLPVAIKKIMKQKKSQHLWLAITLLGYKQIPVYSVLPKEIRQKFNIPKRHGNDLFDYCEYLYGDPTIGKAILDQVELLNLDPIEQLDTMEKIMKSFMKPEKKREICFDITL